MKKWIITVVICSCIAAALIWFKTSKMESANEAKSSQPEYSETVETITARQVKRADTIKAIGETVAPQQVTLRNELSGYITAVNFLSGATVKKNDIIIQLDVSEEAAMLDSAKSRAELAQSIFDREEKLRKSNAVSQVDLDRARSNLAVVNAEMKALESVISKKTIRAPYDGTIGIHQFEIGQYLANNTFITMLVGSSKFMWVDFSVPQFYGDLKNGTYVRVRLVQAQDMVSNNYIEAPIVAVDSSIVRSARSRLYRAKIDTNKLNLIPNASVEVIVPVGDKKKLIAVSTKSILNDSQGQYVYILDIDKKAQAYRARRSLVSVHGYQDNLVLLTKGVKEKEVIAAAGAFKLFEGLLVHGKVRSTTNISSSRKEE